MKILNFTDLSEHTRNVFSSMCKNEVTPEENFNGFRSLIFDCAVGNEIYDAEEDRAVTAREADGKIRKVVFSILGIDEKSSKRDRKRALKKHGNELFEVIEEVIDFKVETGWKESEFFNLFVDERNIARGDRNEFWTDEDVILSVSKIAGDHHDFTLQRLASGESYTVTTSVYGIAVGADIDMYLAGRIDWVKFTDACARAFVVKIQNEMYAQVMNAGTKLPSTTQFTKTMELSEANKDTFDTLLEDVSIANDNVPVYIMGTKSALKKLNKLADVDWITEDQKRQVADMGRLGTYEGVSLIEIPQRFAINDTSKKLVDANKLLIMPQIEHKFVKFVDVGETEIIEVNEKGDRNDDTMKYEVQRTMGVGTQIGRYFGVWTIA